MFRGDAKSAKKTPREGGTRWTNNWYFTRVYRFLYERLYRGTIRRFSKRRSTPVVTGPTWPVDPHPKRVQVYEPRPVTLPRSYYKNLPSFLANPDGEGQYEEEDDFSIRIARYRPEEIGKLMSKTKFTRKEIQLMYRGFKQECPTGMVDEDAFKHIFSQFFPQGDASNYAHYVFNTIKHKQTGKISFEDFLSILSKVSRGTVQEKLQWIFGLYDLDGDGQISKSEMLNVAISIYDMLGRATVPIVDDTSAKQHIDKIFHLIDTNQDGVVTLDELRNWCCRDENFLRSLDTLDTVL